MNALEEWEIRSYIFEEILKLFTEDKKLTSSKIVENLGNKGILVEKKLVNSILFSEGRRYVFYDRANYSYSLSDPGKSPDRQKMLEITKFEHQPKNFSQEENPKPERQKNKPEYIEKEPNKKTAPLLANPVTQLKKYTYSSEEMDTQTTFSSVVKGGSVTIVLNKNHPFYRRLMATTFKTDANEKTLQKKLKIAQSCIRVLIQGWVDFEHEQPVGIRRNFAQDSRIDWGRKVRDQLFDED